jgi:DNA polymerase-3 subunit delta'
VSAAEVQDDVWAGIVGQDDAIRQLEAASRSPVHAYLLVGPSGAGKRALARGFAARLLAAGSTGADAERHIRLALAEQHPDLRVVAPEGMTFRRIDAETLARHASLAPIEGERKVVVGLGCEAMEDEAAGYLLKAVEEPSPSTVFVLLATEVEPELVTIASRCVRVDVRSLVPEAIMDRLTAEGVDPAAAEEAAQAAGGDLERARTLATDARLSLRHKAWSELPSRLDGTGYQAAMVVAELETMIEEALGPLQERQTAEVARVAAEIEQFGLRTGARRDLETRHRREARRFRAAELRFGLATLACAYRAALPGAARPAPLVEALQRIDEAALALIRYPNETLLLQALVAHLPALPARAGSGRGGTDVAAEDDSA